MLNHVTIGVRDLTKACRFYDATLGTLGYKRVAEGDDYVGYGTETPMFLLLPVKTPVPPDPVRDCTSALMLPSG